MTYRNTTISRRAIGTSVRPRLRVCVTNRQVIAQIIDDEQGRTLCYSSSLRVRTGKNLGEQASWVGNDIALQAKTAKISKVVFDRGRRRYHGRIAALATAARAKGLEF